MAAETPATSETYSSGNNVNTSSRERKGFSNHIADFRDEISTLIEPTRHATAGKPIHSASVVFNILQSTMGVGILSLAATFQYAGLAGGSILMVCTAFCAYYSMHLLLSLLLITKQESYEGLGEHCFGKWGKKWVQIMLVLAMVVAMVCFLVPLKAFIFDFLKQMLSTSAFHTFKHHGGSPETCLGAALVLVIIPVSLLRKIDKLWFTSLLGVFFVTFFTIVSIVYIFHEPKDIKDRACNEIKNNDKKDQAFTPTEGLYAFGDSLSPWLQSLSIIACSYCCQFTIFPIYRELKTSEGEVKAAAKLRKSIILSMIIVSIIYCAAAASGYITWREISKEPSSILACYNPKDVVISICYFGMSCVMMFAFPLVNFSVRYSLATLFYSDEECKNLSTQVHIILTFCVIAPVATIALLATKLTTVITVGGAVTAPQICYVIPGALYVKAKSIYDERHPVSPAGTYDSDDDLEGGIEDGLGQALVKKQAVASASPAAGWAMLAFGVCIQGACIAGAVNVLMH